jgi:nicotinate-nucleotide pyrophosphorylase (carboxylating)
VSAAALDPAVVGRLVAAALEEDLGEAGDVTTRAVIPPERRATATIVARAGLVVAGLPLAEAVFRRLDPGLRFEPLADEGVELDAGAQLAHVRGAARSILTGERTALNFLMRACGVATATRRAVIEIEGTGAVILDTRKTVPGLRALDKYAVAVGGGTNHRMGLFDAVLIKDGHLAMAGSVTTAIERVRAGGIASERIAVEVESEAALEEAIRAGAGRALLDNLPAATVRRCVERAAGRIVLEASGGLRPGGLRPVAATGVQFLSLGWLTHSAPAADLALDVVPEA